MKRLLSVLVLLAGLPLLAADSTIANLPTNTVSAADKMVWEVTGLYDYGITYQDFTNQVLRGLGGSGVSLAGTNTWTAPNTFAAAVTVSNYPVSVIGTNVVINSALVSVKTSAGNAIVSLGSANPYYYGRIFVYNNATANIGLTAQQGIKLIRSENVAWGQYADDATYDSYIAQNVIGTLTISTNLAIVGSITSSNGVINYGTGWAGTTNATAPVNAVTPVAYANYTNTTGRVLKVLLYE